MKYLKSIVVAASLAVAAGSKADIVLDFSSLPGAGVTFINGGYILPKAHSTIEDAFGSSAVRDSVGDTAVMLSVFQIISIDAAGKQATVATLNPTGPQYVIDDGAGHLLKANLQWSTISDLAAPTDLHPNIWGFASLSDITYDGSQADLQALAGFHTAALSGRFGFANGPSSLADLFSGDFDATFVGQIYASDTWPLPESSTMIAGALLLLPFAMGGLRFLRNRNGGMLRPGRG